MSKPNLEKYLSLEYTKENILKGVKKSWKKFIEKEIEKEYFHDILIKIKNDQEKGKLIFPFLIKYLKLLNIPEKVI